MDCAAHPHSTNTCNSSSYKVTNIHNNITNVNRVIADENPEIMQWISPLDPERMHQDVRTARRWGIGFWKQTSFGSGEVARVKLIGVSYFITEIREWEGHF